MIGAMCVEKYKVAVTNKAERDTNKIISYIFLYNK